MLSPRDLKGIHHGRSSVVGGASSPLAGDLSGRALSGDQRSLHRPLQPDQSRDQEARRAPAGGLAFAAVDASGAVAQSASATQVSGIVFGDRDGSGLSSASNPGLAGVLVSNGRDVAVTGADGSFTIKGLPAGYYTIEAWHEKYGTSDQTITVGAKDSKTQDFAFKG